MSFMLGAFCESFPEPITLKLGLSGWYKVYIALFYTGDESYTYVKLNGQANWTADPVNCTMHMHLDGDISCEDASKRVEDFCARNYALGESDAEVISQEISFDFSGEFTTSDAENLLVINPIDRHWNRHDAIYLQKREEIAKKRLQIAHKKGQKIYAANRMQISNFGFPYHRPAWNMEFFEKHPEYRVVWRDGQVMGFCSYAFPEVREYMAEWLVEHLKRGYDGLTLLWNRGMFIGFEQPVIDLFRAKSPGVNPCLLPMTDQRLYEVWDELMTEFMRLLHKKVSMLEQQQSRKISIHVIGGYNVAEDRKIGLNFARWAKEGLIREASQADMEMHERLGHREELDRLHEEQYSRYIKILSVGGMDIRYFNPWWRG